jgi:hypothetical protein
LLITIDRNTQLTALISVIASSAPAFHLLLSSSNSDIRQVFAGISPGGDVVNMLFTNYGKRTGAIPSFFLSVAKDRAKLALLANGRDPPQIGTFLLRQELVPGS